MKTKTISNKFLCLFASLLLAAAVSLVGCAAEEQSEPAEETAVEEVIEETTEANTDEAAEADSATETEASAATQSAPKSNTQAASQNSSGSSDAPVVSAADLGHTHSWEPVYTTLWTCCDGATFIGTWDADACAHESELERADEKNHSRSHISANYHYPTGREQCRGCGAER